MKKVMRPRYYCDFCKKGGGSGGHMKKHESRCTLNPARECGMCKLMDAVQPDLAELVSILPHVDDISIRQYSDDGRNSWTHFKEIDATIIKALREAAGNCPACIMAAFRQRGIPVSMAEGFNFTEECKTIWADFNQRLSDERPCW